MRKMSREPREMRIPREEGEKIESRTDMTVIWEVGKGAKSEKEQMPATSEKGEFFSQDSRIPEDYRLPSLCCCYVRPDYFREGRLYVDSVPGHSQSWQKGTESWQ